MTVSWLLKTEPTTYSFDDLLRDGKTRWEGVSAPAALIYLRRMGKSDEVLVYHSGAVRAIVGLAHVVSDPYPDPAHADPRRVVVDIAATGRLPRPVTLAAIKAEKRLAQFPLVRISRLSVMPVTESERALLLALAHR